MVSGDLPFASSKSMKLLTKTEIFKIEFPLNYKNYNAMRNNFLHLFHGSIITCFVVMRCIKRWELPPFVR